MRARKRTTSLMVGIVCIGLLPICTLAKDKPPAFRVMSIAFKEGAHLDSAILQECPVAKIVMDAIERGRVKDSHASTTDLVLRIDRVARLRGAAFRNPGGTELTITVRTAGTRELDQPFSCRDAAFVSVSPASHCSRLAECSEKIATQISTWLSWQAK